jgi:type IX secretion system substrate protein
MTLNINIKNIIVNENHQQEVAMKKTILIFFAVILFQPLVYSQPHIVFQSNFENITLQMPDSIPIGWFKLDVDGINPNVQWAVRDTSVQFCSTCPTRPLAHNSRKALEIPWYAGNGGSFINDDWVWTDSFTVRNGDSLIFWMLLGGIVSYNNGLIDSMQVYVCFDQDPGTVIQKLATIRSLDTSNVWTEYKFNLSSFATQRVYVGFRYNMNVQVDGLWVNIDDMLIGNRNPIGITPISNNVPKRFELRQNYPNPFNPVTNIEFELPKSGHVNLIIYNSIGQEMRTLVNQELKAGSYKVDFDAGNLPSGTYYYRINAGDFTDSKKMIVVK